MQDKSSQGEKMKAKKQYSFRSVLLCAATITTLSGCDRTPVDSDKKSQPLRPVKTLTLETAGGRNTHEFTAVVDAYRKADLSFKVSGELTEILVKEGDRVKKGDVLARLDDADLAIELADAKASSDSSKADFDRAKVLIKTDYISKSDFEHLKASYNSAKAHFDIAENNLRYTQLIASFDGTIARVYPEKFQEINAKSNVVRLHDLTSVKILVDVPQSFMIRMNKESNKGKVSARFNAIPNKVFPLKFSEMVIPPFLTDARSRGLGD